MTLRNHTLETLNIPDHSAHTSFQGSALVDGMEWNVILEGKEAERLLHVNECE